MMGIRFGILTFASLSLFAGCTFELPWQRVDLQDYQINQSGGGAPCYTDETGEEACAPVYLPDDIYIRSASLDANSPKETVVKVARAYCKSQKQVLSSGTNRDGGEGRLKFDINKDVRWMEDTQSWMVFTNCVTKG